MQAAEAMGQLRAPPCHCSTAPSGKTDAPTPSSAQGWAGWGPGQPDLLGEALPEQGLQELHGPFQPQPLCDSVKTVHSFHSALLLRASPRIMKLPVVRYSPVGAVLET